MRTEYVVKFYAYCGMAYELGAYETCAEAEERVKARNRYAKRMGCAVSRIGRHEWEHEEPEDCVMVPDFAGTMSVFKRRVGR